MQKEIKSMDFNLPVFYEAQGQPTTSKDDTLTSFPLPWHLGISY